MKRVTITQVALEAAEKRLSKELREVRDNLDAERTKQKLPELRKKYEGKYFKYKNAYSTDQQWWLYSRCVRVNSLRSFIVDDFQSKPFGEKEFSCNKDMGGDHLFQVRITKAEYTRELKKMIRTLNKLL